MHKFKQNKKQKEYPHKYQLKSHKTTRKQKNMFLQKTFYLHPSQQKP